MTMSARPPWRAFSRRALARISITVTRGLSSRNSGTSRRPIARPIRAQSDSLRRPLRIFVESTLASLDRMRWVSSSWPISSENTSTGLAVVWATCDGHAEAERRLAHRRAGADDVQRRGLQPRQQLVEVVVAGGRAGDRVAAGERLLEAVHHRP